MSITCPILRRALLGALTLTGVAFATSTLAQQPTAQLVPWRHGVLEAKSDAGFVFMASKGGFAEKQGLKIEIMQFKGDALALACFARRRDRQLRGQPRQPDDRGVARSRVEDARLLLANPQLRHLFEIKHRERKRPQRQILCDLFARLTARTCWRARCSIRTKYQATT